MNIVFPKSLILLKPQDVLVAVYLATRDEAKPTYAAIAGAVRLSASDVHGAVRRSIAAGLLDAEARKPIRRNLIEFLIHGLRYVFIPAKGPLTRGVPTAHSAAPLSDEIGSGGEPPLVWPHPAGTVRGESLEPLSRGAVEAALADPELYQNLALVDALRVGNARERKLAEDYIRKRLS